jgi:hypothetical protein
MGSRTAAAAGLARTRTAVFVLPLLVGSFHPPTIFVSVHSLSIDRVRTDPEHDY